ncbi:hypothetical protein PTT_06712 [Pyrenophora teres f. teres 0-1]|uniref:Uncharacterized protein n=1 Tax=Pyrenophora teres f. teres (strain 0-1) TaxID=861557 RepID=E3RG20_PYRTT|nr:hypothetical protein PTT_06712 [Pyrenophora teres f. teres 0-1]
MAATHTSALPGFTPIAPSVWDHTPAELYRLTLLHVRPIEAPFLVLLCTWTSAKCRHIAKYTAEYQRRFPSTHIMVVTTSVKHLCFRSARQEQQRLKPAVDRIVHYQRFRPNSRTRAMLMHVFSDGGSHKTCELAEAYYTTTRERLPPLSPAVPGGRKGTASDASASKHRPPY